MNAARGERVIETLGRVEYKDRTDTGPYGAFYVASMAFRSEHEQAV